VLAGYWLRRHGYDVEHRLLCWLCLPLSTLVATIARLYNDVRYRCRDTRFLKIAEQAAACKAAASETMAGDAT
jgi:hypothetical protein